MASSTPSSGRAPSDADDDNLEQYRNNPTSPTASIPPMGDSIKNAESEALDGGWGWVVVFGSFLAQFVHRNVTVTKGLLYLRLLDKYNEGETKTSIPFMLVTIFCMLPGPVYGLLAARCGVRGVTFTGSLLICAGLVASAWMPSLAWFNVFYGVLQGVGAGMVVTPSLIIVQQYFHHKKFLAMAMTHLCVCVAFAISPLLSSTLLEAYGLEGTLMILGALSLNGCVSGAIFIPLSKMVRIEATEKALKYQTTMDQLSERTSINDTIPQRYDSALVYQEKPSLHYQGHCDDSATESTENICTLTQELQDEQYASRTKRFQANCGAVCSPQFTMHCLLIGTFALCTDLFTTFFPALVEELEIYHQPLLMGIFGSMMTIGALLWGCVFDISSLHPWRPHIFASTAIGSAFAMAIMPSMASLASMCVVGVFAGAIVGASFGLTIALVSEYVLREHMPFAVGVAKMSEGLGALVADPVGGALAEHLGTYTVGFYLGASVLGVAAVTNLIYHVCTTLGRNEPHRNDSNKD